MSDLAVKHKRCSTCKKRQSLDNFCKDASRPDGINHHCKKCSNDRVQRYLKAHPEKMKQYKLREGHNISLEQYKQLLENQNHRCAICEIHVDDLSRSLHVDHDRKCCSTKKSCGSCVRGLLCHNCNTAIGLLREDRVIFERALLYIEGVSCQTI